MIALLAFSVTRQYTGAPNDGLIFIIGLLAVAMVVCWLAALVRLWRQHDWGWLAAVLVLHLVGLGIVGMVAYAIAGPIDIDISKPGIT